MSTALTPITVPLRRLREAAGLTQIQLAELANVRQATISDIETGKTKGIDFEVLDRLCAVLQVEPGELLEREDRKRRRS